MYVKYKMSCCLCSSSLLTVTAGLPVVSYQCPVDALACSTLYWIKWTYPRLDF